MFYLNASDRYVQQGFILIMVLFFLFILSLMALSLLNTANLELCMGQNRVIASQQFQAADAGLKIAENKLVDLSLKKILVLHEQLNYAGFKVSYDIKRYIMPFCINQKLAYTYRIISQAKQIAGRPLTLETSYAITMDKVCHGGEAKLIRVGHSTWRELNKFYS